MGNPLPDHGPLVVVQELSQRLRRLDQQFDLKFGAAKGTTITWLTALVCRKHKGPGFGRGVSFFSEVGRHPVHAIVADVQVLNGAVLIILLQPVAELHAR